MSDSTLEVHKAVVAALKADAAVGALAGDRVYDEVPADVVFPHIELEKTLAQPALETQGGEGFEVAITLHTWSRKHGTVECSQIMAAIHDALHLNDSLSLDTLSVVRVDLLDQRVLKDPDGITAHGVQRFSVITDD